MAKKNLNLFRKSKEIKEQSRRSDQDYLDAFVSPEEGEPQPSMDLEPTAPAPHPAETVESVSAGEGSRKTSTSAQPKEAQSKPLPSKTDESLADESSSIRTTMTLGEADFETFRDIMHTVKSSGHYQYAQRDAFAEAVALLKAKIEAEIGPLHQAPPKKRGRW